MPVYVAVAGWLLIGLLFVVAQQKFYSAHREAHHQWTRSQQGGFGKMDEILSATFHVDEDHRVERARRRYLAVMTVGVIYLVIGFPLGIWIESVVNN